MTPARRDRLWAGAMTAIVVVLLALVLWRGWLLVATGEPVGLGIGVAVVVIGAVGFWVLWRSVLFGLHTQTLARELEAEGGLPVDELPRRPSGRPEREAADALFAERRAETELAPQDWRSWFRLGLAYDDAGDRRRAREAMRTAIRLRRGPLSGSEHHP